MGATLGFTRAEAQRCMREWLRRPSGMILSDHAKERMAERGISRIDVYRILQRGCLQDGLMQTDHGEWKCKMTLRIGGNRTAGVVALLLRASGVVLVKTVQWEDFH